jgi:hypothetical protein
MEGLPSDVQHLGSGGFPSKRKCPLFTFEQIQADAG